MTMMYEAPVRRPASPAAGASVRTCSACGRPLPALTRDEYTRARAGLVASRGICVCREPQAASPWHGERA
ncbi:hypothetical protein HC031_29895 [Planosporangium thailandense]|uniref:Uncharacterized protein n=1 Tax=Planosporangium thailandense TaxID=765197 RepID=A0ABX0Y9H7_9ACTN|nr:hypothetical protein [Planosporangium thailandense]NJC73894.1 hypothetical protein [Planosporangium thailandense]